MKNTERLANLALAVYVGCYRSVKPTPPSETMSKEHAMHFPFVGSAMLLSLFLLFKFLSKDLVKIILGTLKIFMENYPMILLYLYCMAAPCIS
ncbi:hypothetical protein ES319_D01G166100v1 [Gossypium barbadense]|uniref:Uncharacterized protein n=1 Tax=Gossypium barbadense TaxID=3634 RepID=A0A5J5SV99_GOSBA|nr:hypothetical protein ES319_D01G166100v1 [Gossypium barbadense]